MNNLHAPRQKHFPIFFFGLKYYFSNKLIIIIISSMASLCFQTIGKSMGTSFAYQSYLHKRLFFTPLVGTSSRSSRCICLSMKYIPRPIFLTIAVSIAVTDHAYASQSFDESKSKDKIELPSFITTNSGLRFLDIKVGSGSIAEDGCKSTFHYIGRLAGRQGKQFEDTYGEEPYRITLGKDRVIAGLEEGLRGMREGGKRRLLIPSSLGYSNRSMRKYEKLTLFRVYNIIAGLWSRFHAVSEIVSAFTGLRNPLHQFFCLLSLKFAPFCVHFRQHCSQ